MSNEEIIDELNRIASDFENERLDTTEWVAYEYDPDEAAEAIRAGAEAKEYRTPKKIIKMLATNRIGIEELCYDCPACHGSVHYMQMPISYCAWCGQALDWTEDEE